MLLSCEAKLLSRFQDRACTFGETIMPREWSERMRRVYKTKRKYLKYVHNGCAHARTEQNSDQ
jgi:hypothetical protein